MYPCTAAIGAALQKLERYPSQDMLIIEAQSNLKAAYTLMSDRWTVHYSIYWNQSNAKTKYTVCARLEGISYDAKTAVIDAGNLLNLYVDRNHIPEEYLNNWHQIIQDLTNAHRWISRDYCDNNCKQLKLLVLE
jgi:hypothetical protein